VPGPPACNHRLVLKKNKRYLLEEESAGAASRRALNDLEDIGSYGKTTLLSTSLCTFFDMTA
jgi:hypothetical protein